MRKDRNILMWYKKKSKQIKKVSTFSLLTDNIQHEFFFLATSPLNSQSRNKNTIPVACISFLINPHFDGCIGRIFTKGFANNISHVQ